LIDNLMIELDGSDNKAKLGERDAGGQSGGRPGGRGYQVALPLRAVRTPQCRCLMNVINGGKHGDNRSTCEFMIAPVGTPLAKLCAGCEITRRSESGQGRRNQRG
jgi:enolase